MDQFLYDNGALRCEEVSLHDVAGEYGTPVYVYSRNTFRRHLSRFTAIFGDLDAQVRYGVKALANTHLLRDVADQGAGADVVSGGELYRALMAGIPAERLVFAGVGKSRRELREAIEAGIGCVNVESAPELEMLEGVAMEAGRSVHAAIRINPDVEGHGTPEKTTTGVRGSKFGVDIERVSALFDRGTAFEAVTLVGVHVHLGSPIYSPEPYARALHKVLAVVEQLQGRGHEIATINVGGGFAAQYQTHLGPQWEGYAAAIVPLLKPFVDRGGQVLLEPGRSIAANAGVLLAQVRYLKDAGGRRVAVVDAGMNELLRIVLYEAFHFIWPVQPAGGLVPPHRGERVELNGLRRYDIAGPLCESSDYLARGRDLPELKEGDLICVFGAGAYCMTMASQYNSVPRPPEVLVDGGATRLIRRRETYADLVAAETSLPAAVRSSRSTPARRQTAVGTQRL